MRKLILNIIAYTAISVVASVAITGTILMILGAPVWGNALAISIICPALIAPPITLLDCKRRIRLQALMDELGAAHAALNQAYEQMAEQASRDGLTGLCNRTAFFEKAERFGARAAIVLLIDIDHFKAINDAHGHIVGDTALKTVAVAIAQVVGSLGTVARVGGEEFAVYLPEMAPEVAATLAERIRRRIVRLRATGAADRPMPLSVSIGCAALGSDRTFLEAYQEADRELYRAKHEGRNMVRGLGEPSVAA